MSKSKSDSNSRVAIGLIIICIVAIALLVTGCDTAGKTLDIYATTEGEAEPNLSKGNPVEAPSDIKYLVPNALEEVLMDALDPPRDVVGKEHTVSYYVYKGLKSKEVEDKVNAQIETIIFDMGRLLSPETIAPFRGIKTVVDDASILSDSYISLYTSFSANNLLSVRGYGSGTYKASVEAFNETTWLSLTRGLTLDLNTGERVPLEALFVDGYDYESVINTAIVAQIEQNNLMDEAYLEYTFFPARLTKPFDGIDHDQAYCLDQFNLTIIIDENDPRFDTAFEQVTFSIELAKFGDQLALDKRYFDPDKTLFVDETERRLLPIWKTDGRGNMKNYEGTFEGGNWYLMAYNQDDQLVDVYDAIVSEAKTYLENLKIQGKDNHAEMSLAKTTIGRFISVSKNIWMSQGDAYYSSMEYELFDTTGKRLTLDDLFVAGYDYEAVLKKQVHDQVVLNGDYTDFEIESAYATKSFTLDQSNLTLSVSLPERDTGGYIQQVYIPFEVFGVDNMTIFD